jgi:hypothetical protein
MALHIGSRLLRMVLWALLALVLGYVVAFAAGLLAFEVFDVSQREGAAAMGLAFVIAPFVAGVSSLTAAIWYWIASRTDVAPTASSTANRRRAYRVVVFIVAGAFGWYAGAFLQWMLAGQAYETFVLALTVALAPWLGLLGCAGTAGWILWRRQSSA